METTGHFNVGLLAAANCTALGGASFILLFSDRVFSEDLESARHNLEEYLPMSSSLARRHVLWREAGYRFSCTILEARRTGTRHV